MSDQVDTFRAMKEHSQSKRASNRATSTALVAESGYPFTVHNGGAHLIVHRRWDFWPGTGKWIDRREGKYRRGVFTLLAAIKEATR